MLSPQGRTRDRTWNISLTNENITTTPICPEHCKHVHLKKKSNRNRRKNQKPKQQPTPPSQTDPRWAETKVIWKTKTAFLLPKLPTGSSKKTTWTKFQMQNSKDHINMIKQLKKDMTIFQENTDSWMKISKLIYDMKIKLKKWDRNTNYRERRKPLVE